MSVLFYKSGGRPLPETSLDAAYSDYFWQPQGVRIIPLNHSFRGPVLKPAVQYGILHGVRVFTNSDYCISLILHSGRLAHVSFIYPGYFRFPFMAPSDLQIGDTWTDTRHRGKGLAGFAIAESIRRLGREGRAFWYLCDSGNQPSIRVIEKAGFEKVGEGFIKKRWGLSTLGEYTMTRQE